MGRGRKPQPTALKILKGTQPCRVNAAEPVFPAGAPEPPGYLEGEALDLWRELAPTLAAARVLTAADGPALAVLCEAYRLWREFPSDPKRCSHYRAMLAEFGLTPSSRSKVKAVDAGPRDELAEFLNRKGRA